MVGLASEAWVYVPGFTAQAVTSELPGPSRGTRPATGMHVGDAGPAEHVGRDRGAAGLVPPWPVTMGTVRWRVRSLWGREAALLFTLFLSASLRCCHVDPNFSVERNCRHILDCASPILGRWCICGAGGAKAELAFRRQADTTRRIRRGSRLRGAAGKAPVPPASTVFRGPCPPTPAPARGVSLVGVAS